jgi:class 3 adenylate cyclase
MVEVPHTRYVTVGDADVAYQVLGEGPIDLLYFYGLGNHIDLGWDIPAAAELNEGLASFSRLIMFDRRGTGASDAVANSAIPTWEQWTDDILGVLDEVGSERAAILAAVDAGPIAVLFTAMHPERVRALVLLNTSARALRAEDYPIGRTPEDVDVLIKYLGDNWGTPEVVLAAVPSLADDPETLSKLTRQIRAAATPRSAAAQYEYMVRNLDVRDVLALIQVPTLVLHVRESPMWPLDHGRYLASNIQGARLVELPGADTAVANGRMIAEEVGEFVTGERPVLEVERILTTVLFTDIVGSTQRAADIGDERWRSVLDAHDQAVRDQLKRFRGREVKTTGDGFLASFDGPARAIRCATEIVEATHNLGVEIRAGLHTGECDVRDNDLSGMAVHIASRVGSMATAHEVLVSGTLKDLVIGSGIEFADRGEHELKGVPGAWRLYAVRG